jgi:hypothetical protein
MVNDSEGNKVEDRSKISQGSVLKYRDNSLDNVNFDNRYSNTRRLNSPRSVEALLRAGYTQEELHYIPFKDYKILNPGTNEGRFQYQESRRKEKLEEVRSIRNTLNPEDVLNYNISQVKSFNGGRSQSQISQSQIKSTAINNELKAFERIKKKQEMDLINMVQYELKMEMMRKENEEKLMKEKEKAERYKMEVMMNHKIEEDKRRQREKEKQEKMEREEMERKKRDQEKYEMELKRMKEDMEREEQRNRENRLKQEEEKRKQEEFKMMLENMAEEQRLLAERKAKELEEKEQIRKQILEAKRMEMTHKSMEKQTKKQLLIQQNMENLEEKLNKQRNEYLFKQKRNDIRKEQFEEKREQMKYERKIQSENRAREIKQVLEKNQEMEKEKVEIYNEKQRAIQEKKEELERINKLEQESRIENNRLREMKIRNTLRANEEILEEKKSQIMGKIIQKESLQQEASKQRELLNMEKCESSTIRKMEKEDTIKRISRIQNYERMKIMEKLEEKSLRLDEFKFQKSIISEKKREMQDDINRKKQEYVEKFEKIFKKKNIDEGTLKTLQKMFPDNPELSSAFSSMKTTDATKGYNRNSSSHGFNSTYNLREKKLQGFNTTGTAINNSQNLSQSKTQLNESLPQIKKKNIQSYTSKKEELPSLQYPMAVERLPEKEIVKRVDEYRLKLNQNLLKILSDERQKEDDRERMLQLAKNNDERHKLEKYFGSERATATTKILKFNE